MSVMYIKEDIMAESDIFKDLDAVFNEIKANPDEFSSDRVDQADLPQGKLQGTLKDVQFTDKNKKGNPMITIISEIIVDQKAHNVRVWYTLSPERMKQQMFFFTRFMKEMGMDPELPFSQMIEKADQLFGHAVELDHQKKGQYDNWYIHKGTAQEPIELVDVEDDDPFSKF